VISWSVHKFYVDVYICREKLFRFEYTSPFRCFPVEEGLFAFGGSYGQM
jgi:hypothetical protein